MPTLPFFSTCVDWPLPVPRLTELVDDSREISRRTFLKYVNSEEMRQIESDLGYERHPSRGLTMANDYAVTYHRSKLGNCPSVFFVWSATEYVFIEPTCVSEYTE